VYQVQTRYKKQSTPGISEFEESQTQQHFKNECNIHEIIERSKRGIMPDQGSRAPIFGDFSVVTDYQSAYEALAVSEEAFLTLKPEVRARFKNDPAQLLTWLTESNNKEEAIKLGLVDAPVEPPKALADEIADAIDRQKKKAAKSAKDQLPT